MSSRDLTERIVEQFTDDSERADIWRGFEYVLETDSFLNLGYSGPFRTHLLGDPQARLVERVVDRAASLRPKPAEERLLDVGCGRGVPTAYAASAHGFEAVGVDLVPYNVRMARANVADAARPPEFVVGDATALPFRDDSVAAAVSIDAVVYVPDKDATYAELSRVLDAGGSAVVSDLVAADEADVDRAALERFGRAWDMPSPVPFSTYARTIEGTALRIRDVEDLTAHSVGGFRKWSRLFLALADGPSGPAFRRLLQLAGLEPPVVTAQVRAAHRALPALRHVLVTLER
ncbi:class I SAM-dependent methyltransferase [Halovivax sp.]|uniref:class I SAM-dependent methyltransferase n=1 Tax=Halovivax sp. TaxID=1935978 RepID=UPI0025C5E80D|nr:class I SAM-dependent methyltransferase [Halovivax sp.]